MFPAHPHAQRQLNDFATPADDGLAERHPDAATSSTQLTDLPPELIEQIAGHLPTEDILALVRAHPPRFGPPTARMLRDRLIAWTQTVWDIKEFDRALAAIGQLRPSHRDQPLLELERGVVMLPGRERSAARTRILEAAAGLDDALLGRLDAHRRIPAHGSPRAAVLAGEQVKTVRDVLEAFKRQRGEATSLGWWVSCAFLLSGPVWERAYADIDRGEKLQCIAKRYGLTHDAINDLELYVLAGPGAVAIRRGDSPHTTMQRHGMRLAHSNGWLRELRKYVNLPPSSDRDTAIERHLDFIRQFADGNRRIHAAGPRSHKWRSCHAHVSLGELDRPFDATAGSASETDSLSMQPTHLAPELNDQIVGHPPPGDMRGVDPVADFDRVLAAIGRLPRALRDQPLVALERSIAELPVRNHASDDCRGDARVKLLEAAAGMDEALLSRLDAFQRIPAHGSPRAAVLAGEPIRRVVEILGRFRQQRDQDTSFPWDMFCKNRLANIALERPCADVDAGGKVRAIARQYRLDDWIEAHLERYAVQGVAAESILQGGAVDETMRRHDLFSPQARRDLTRLKFCVELEAGATIQQLVERDRLTDQHVLLDVAQEVAHHQIVMGCRDVSALVERIGIQDSACIERLRRFAVRPTGPRPRRARGPDKPDTVFEATRYVIWNSLPEHLRSMAGGSGYPLSPDEWPLPELDQPFGPIVSPAITMPGAGWPRSS